MHSSGNLVNDVNSQDHHIVYLRDFNMLAIRETQNRLLGSFKCEMDRLEDSALDLGELYQINSCEVFQHPTPPPPPHLTFT